MNLFCYKKMKQLLVHNWQAKLVCLALASVLWYVLRDTSRSGSGDETTWRLQPPPVWEERGEAGF